MSWFSNIFGGKKEKPANPNDAIQKTNTHVELLQKREKLLQKKIDEEVNKAKEYLKKGNKSAAALCMKRKKAYEQQIERLNNQMMNMTNISMKLEEAAMDVEHINAQQDAAKALKKIYKGMDASKVDEKMEEVRNAVEDANEISSALAQPMGIDPVDDDEVQDELAALEEQVSEQEILDMPEITKEPIKKTGTKTPAVATKPEKVAVPATASKKKAAPVDEDDEDLKALEAELGM